MAVYFTLALNVLSVFVYQLLRLGPFLASSARRFLYLLILNSSVSKSSLVCQSPFDFRWFGGTFLPLFAIFTRCAFFASLTWLYGIFVVTLQNMCTNEFHQNLVVISRSAKD